MLFLLFQSLITVLELVQCTRKGSRCYAPRSGECILKLTNITACRIRFNCTAREDDVADGVDVRIGSTSIDELSMVGALFTDEQFSDLAARGEACS